ncbi:MAG: T9SS type A sorting domain-containing protein [Candidatus Eisenbacteria bacterium]|uniref:T9SS type A sorting domain-containing protein n=1 Tax=Eiseniibacteriota bacterium TaxID=2212470 RepID=A0A538SGQ6_UNCEI|nr:MAG: T9SS type A sorting domain-containing protein [Candidatus Eisenbacteria bacterium]
MYATRLGTDGVVAALISLVRADAEPAGVHLEWASSTGAGTSTEVWRRDDTHDWSLLAALEADGSGRIVFDDRTVAGGMRYWYRLRLDLDGQVRDTPEFEIDVPLQPELALERARPNPADADLFIDFSLPDARPATVELVDVQGRVRLSRSTDLGAGRHAMRLARRGELPMGMYWVRLTHGADARVVKVAVVR